MSLNSAVAASPNPKSPMLNALRPAMVCPPGMPTVALALPMPAQSVGIVWNFTRVKPSSSSLRALALRVRVQLSAAPKKGESNVEIKLLWIGARSGSALYFCSETRAKSRSLLERLASSLKSPWWVLCLSEKGATRLLVLPGRLGSGYRVWLPRIARAIGLKRLAGMTLPGKGRPV